MMEKLDQGYASLVTDHSVLQTVARISNWERTDPELLTKEAVEKQQVLHILCVCVCACVFSLS